MTTTLITGGAGFIGQHLTAHLTAAGRQVLVLDRTGQATFDDPAVSVILGDIRDPTAVTEAMSHADSWVHLAGVLGTQETVTNPRPAAETNVLGGLNVLEAAAQYRLPGVNIAVGNWWMLNTYAITKTTVEKFAAMYRDERHIAVSVVRALNAYGPGQSIAAPYGPSKVRKIMPSFICRALTGNPIEIYGDGQQIMDMIHVSDVAWALAATLTYTEEHGALSQPIEAGTGRRTTVREIAETIVAAAGSTSVIHHLPMRPGETPGAEVLADTSTLLGIANPALFTTLETGAANTVAWYAQHWLPSWLADHPAPTETAGR
ncbi:NAD-dependent epimerase/dehydratase family protein [Parafrankia discariae]|uniref:NAD-dependent epimerase/dehydratase family protein n=1 Tax=Parafrankia discariae TaxID=365528 RepID=UPI0003612119|nr:NAD-dependent epimerase/dehydratase family protein [Parafrankia discariae]